MTSQEPRKYRGKVLITGASGHLGANLTRRVLDDGHEVRVLLQEGANNGAVDGLDVERVYGDLRDAGALRQLIRGCETVYHCAAKLSTLWGSRKEELEIYETNVQGTRDLLAAAAAEDVEKVVVSGSFSAVGFDPDDPGKPVDESYPFFPFARWLPYARSKALVEHMCLQANVRGLPTVVAVSTGIVGPNDHIPSRMGRTFLDHTHGRLRAYIDGGSEFVTARDICEGHVLAMHKGTPGERYIISTAYHSLDEIVSFFEEVNGVPKPKLKVPTSLMLPIAEVVCFFQSRFFPEASQRLTPGAIEILRKHRRADISKARNELGFQPGSIREAYYEAYEDFARRGLVPARTWAPGVRQPQQSERARPVEEVRHDRVA